MNASGMVFLDVTKRIVKKCEFELHLFEKDLYYFHEILSNDDRNRTLSYSVYRLNSLETT